MELIPILSLIMLVATIATFILAIGAYILYKIRERNGRRDDTQEPETVPAELVTPSYLSGKSRDTYTGDLGRKSKRYTEYQSSERQPRMRQTIVKPIYSNVEYKSESKQDIKRSTDETDHKKYLRYTQDGYVDPQKDKNKENVLKWR